jgi:CheY-like chemotaxis protein
VLEVSSTLKRLLPKNISVLETFAQGDLFINGNEKQLYQVLLNLGINAGDAMPNGGELSFKLSVVDSSANEIERNRSVRIEVKDTGTGIPNEIQKRIFEPFFTTKGVGKGTGLGLSIVHGFITAHHGTIEVKSIPDSGTVFTISLPLIEAIQPIAEKSEIDLDIIKNATLLIVDDENSLRKPLAEILRSYGLTVIEAEDGKSALKIFGKKEHKFDLVLTDMGMPNMDGLELITRLRKIRRGIKTIVMTGYLDMKQTKTLEEQNISVISKPFETTALLTEIKRVLSMPEKAKRPNKIHKT